ncbi:DUF6161 domain-containing protein [Flavobacterium gelidilacus]|uniref:DUF6161 domain-containing protein n=1 Tax=Flavobacterium gelidilacus TaxID=206041 RepID=UPI00040A422D|nr:DUF6161 domain-containing protein [Flavobacterium gelidilacus]
MDIKAFRKLVESSHFKEQLNSIAVTIRFEYSNSKIELKGIQSIYKFIYDQVIGWNKIEKIPPYFLASKMHFEVLKSSLVSLASYTELNLQNRFENKFRQLQRDLNNEKGNRNDFIFIYDSPETDFLISVYNKKSTYFNGALDYITDANLNYRNDHDYFTGLLLAYEFKNQAESEIPKRRNSEKLSLSQLKTKYNEYIVEAEQQLNSNLSDAKDNLTNHFETVDKLKAEKDKNFEDWFSGVQSGFDTFFTSSSDSIKENEDLYREKLRLEAPAKYWKDRAIELKKEGNKYLNWLIRTSVIAAVLLFTLLMLLGTTYFETTFNDNIKGIKWSIILITIVSLLAFTIKILSKMTFSSFHLSRDAEEREQLTHFYLALKKDTTIEPEERQLILQSLFSRADTGLLKEDSSPTMPTSIIEKFAGGK